MAIKPTDDGILFVNLLGDTPSADREEAFERAFDALELFDAGDYDGAVEVATEALLIDPLNPWALLALGDARVGLSLGNENVWEDPAVQAQRLPHLWAAYHAGLALAREKQASMAPPIDDVWNMVEARPYVRAALILVDVLEMIGRKAAAKRIHRELKARKVWKAG